LTPSADYAEAFFAKLFLARLIISMAQLDIDELAAWVQEGSVFRPGLELLGKATMALV
jgi:hypothetical protein